ncbi:uncharacterized protein LOC125759130 [Rhipicephalus sanguineus]|uniref:uncharacterized protein LOC125759130 n=1 Tax=Rhipicephalus sanguineus TaxID=34632 RepID=UPI0020C59E7C|nr:uncharacterized protein LOC125759130 [Rhipicephalus sanguineus]
MDVQPHEAPSGSGSTAGIASRKRGNTSSESDDTELYSASGDESSEDGFQPVLYRKAKRRIINASSASSTATVKTAPQRWPHSILFVPQNATDSLRVLNRQALSLYLENTVPNEIKDVRLNTRRNILAVDVMNPSALSTLQQVTKLGNITVKSIIPADGATTAGVIYDIDTEIPNVDLPVLIKPASQDNVIVNVGRLGNTRCVRVTFKGDCLPSYVKVGHFRHQVRPFIPKPMQCFNCQKIGHVKGVCRNSAVCPRGVSSIPVALVPTNGGFIRLTNPQAVQKELKATSNHFQTITDVRQFGRGGIVCRSPDQTCVQDLLKCTSFASTPTEGERRHAATSKAPAGGRSLPSWTPLRRLAENDSSRSPKNGSADEERIPP